MNSKCCKCGKDAKFYNEWRYVDKDSDRVYYCADCAIEQNKTLLFYIPEEQQEQNTNAYVLQVKGIKSDKWQNYKAFNSYIKAKFMDIKESLKANFLTWLYGINNYESRIMKYERTTVR